MIVLLPLGDDKKDELESIVERNYDMTGNSLNRGCHYFVSNSMHIGVVVPFSFFAGPLDFFFIFGILEEYFYRLVLFVPEATGASLESGH